MLWDLMNFCKETPDRIWKPEGASGICGGDTNGEHDRGGDIWCQGSYHGRVDCKTLNRGLVERKGVWSVDKTGKDTPKENEDRSESDTQCESQIQILIKGRPGGLDGRTRDKGGHCPKQDMANLRHVGRRKAGRGLVERRRADRWYRASKQPSLHMPCTIGNSDCKFQRPFGEDAYAAATWNRDAGKRRGRKINRVCPIRRGS